MTDGIVKCPEHREATVMEIIRQGVPSGGWEMSHQRATGEPGRPWL